MNLFVPAIVDGDVGNYPVDPLVKGEFVQDLGHLQQPGGVAVNQGAHVREFIGNPLLLEIPDDPGDKIAYAGITQSQWDHADFHDRHA